jgi:chromate transporter
MTLWQLVYAFFTVGLLTIGGGLVSIPLLFEVFVSTSILTSSFFYQLVSIAESTPGPIAINLATYLGFTQHGGWGAILATTSFMLPSFFILSMVYPLYLRYRHFRILIQIMNGIKLTVLGLIAVTLFRVTEHVIEQSMDTIVASLLGFVFLGILFYFNQKRPLLIIGAGALFGVIFLA